MAEFKDLSPTWVLNKKDYSIIVSTNADGIRYIRSLGWTSNSKIFGSILAQNGVSTTVTQRLLEHSSSYLTNKLYTNVDPVLRHVVDQIPAGDWL